MLLTRYSYWVTAALLTVCRCGNSGSSVTVSSNAYNENVSLLSAAQLERKYHNIAESHSYRFFDIDMNGDRVLDKIVVERLSEGTEPKGLNLQGSNIYVYVGVDDAKFVKHSVIRHFNSNGRFHLLGIRPRNSFNGLTLINVAASRNAPFLNLYLNYEDGEWVIAKFTASAEDLSQHFSYKCVYKDNAPYTFFDLENFPYKEQRLKSELLATCPADPVLGAFYEITEPTELFDQDFKPTKPPTYLNKGDLVESDSINEDWVSVGPASYLGGLDSIAIEGWINTAHIKQLKDIYP